MMKTDFQSRFCFIKLGDYLENTGYFSRLQPPTIYCQGYNRRAGYLEAQIIRGHAELQSIIAQGNDGAANTAAGDHLVARLQLAQHVLPFFLPPLLGHNEQKIENRENQDQRQQAPTQGPATIFGLQKGR